MNRKPVFLTALLAVLFPMSLAAQMSPAVPAAPVPQGAQATEAVPPVPQAIPARIALIAFEQAVLSTNEGERQVQALQQKYEPQKAKIDVLSTEIASLQKQLQAAPATLSDEERAERLKTIDAKQKEYNRDVDDAQTAYQADLQEIYGKVATKVKAVMDKYVAQNGYTIALDVGSQQSPVMWALPATDVTGAVIQAYNKASGIAPPTPEAPTATRPRPATTPHTTTPKAPGK